MKVLGGLHLGRVKRRYAEDRNAKVALKYMRGWSFHLIEAALLKTEDPKVREKKNKRGESKP